MIEALAGFVVIWLFTGSRLGSSHAERRAQQMIATSFYLLAAYVGIEATRTLINAAHPQTSWVGIALAAFTAVTMPLLARAKRHVGTQLNSSAAVKEASQTSLCAYLSVALLIGLGTNALSAGGGLTRSPRSRSPPSRSGKAGRAGAARAAPTVLLISPESVRSDGHA